MYLSFHVTRVTACNQAAASRSSVQSLLPTYLDCPALASRHDDRNGDKEEEEDDARRSKECACDTQVTRGRRREKRLAREKERKEAGQEVTGRTFNAMFFRIVSSSTACSLRLISNDRSSVISDSLALLYSEDMVVPPLRSRSRCVTDAGRRQDDGKHIQSH